jgi:hypothetical protein
MPTARRSNTHSNQGPAVPAAGPQPFHPAMNANRQEPDSVAAEAALLAVIYAVLLAAYWFLAAVLH